MRRVAALALAFSLLLSVVVPSPALASPTIQARTWAIVDAEDGSLLAGQNPHAQTAMASLTKVMTALVAVERGDLEQRVTIVPSDLVGGSSASLRSGETVSLRTLLYGLLLPSGNDAAMAIARAVGGSPSGDDPAARQRFVDWMNDRAAALGLTGTHFANPHGLDQEGHYTTAADLAAIVRAALQNTAFVEVIRSPSYSGDGHQYTSVNKLLQTYPGIIGGKTGITDNAGYALIEVAQRDGHTLIVVLIGSTPGRWWSDATTLLDDGWTIPFTASSPARAAADFLATTAVDDKPVATGATARGWVWGVPDGGPRTEPYVSAPGGSRPVQYFDKGRLEITNPGASPNSPGYVTAGRLTWELITGKQQVGDDSFQFRAPAKIPLAGDVAAAGPTYASLTPLLTAAPAPAGSPLTARLTADGSVQADAELAGYQVTAAAPLPETGHGVASVFDAYLGQRGPVFVDGRIQDGPLFSSPFAVTGLPITEAYWLRVPVRGAEQDVLLQCFERRCLTYTPTNPAGWQVEMTNVGQHYLQWLAQQPVVEGSLPFLSPTAW